MHANCPKDRLGNRMGIHDVERQILLGYPLPKDAGYFVPPARSDSPRQTGHADDVFVMEDGTIFGSSSDPGAGGLWAMRARPGGSAWTRSPR